MPSPLLQTQIDIDAPPAAVWALISDLRRMPEWSPQCRWMKVLGPVRPGTRTVNINRRNFAFWPTTSTIVEVIPEKKLAFRVDTNRTLWSYELEAHGAGTRLIESRHAENGVSAISSLAVKAMGGNEGFEQEMLAGMNSSLAAIKAVAERG